MWKKSLLKVGGWMKYKIGYVFKKKRGFTIIESLAYIFLTTMILASGISLFTSMYRAYLESIQLSINYNNYQNFFIDLDNIISEGGIKEITVNNNQIKFLKNDEFNSMDKIIKSYEGKVFIKYTRNDVTQTINTMLEDIDNLEIKGKGKLIYFMLHDKDGREFIKCI
jgi:hypothetical protein